MFLVRIAAVVFVFQIAEAQAEEPSFAIDPPQISAGQTARLAWKWSPATEGYLSVAGILKNPADGTLDVDPMQTTEYILVLEAPGNEPKILSQRLVVQAGAKGSISEWPENPFAPLAYDEQGDVPSRSFVGILARARMALEKFETQQFKQDTDIVLLTAFLQRSDIGKPDERPPRIRRIAYRVALSSRGKLVHYNISATIKYKLLIYRQLFAENPSTSGELYRAQILAVKKGIFGD